VRKYTIKPIAELARDLRTATAHTQQSFATLLGWSISTCVRFEHGAIPSAPLLAQLVAQAEAAGQDDIAEQLRLHLNVQLGPNFPLTPDPQERYFVLIARRIFQDKRRHAAFLAFAQPEVEQLQVEAEFAKERADKLFNQLDDYAERQKALRELDEQQKAKREKKQ
jgi:hypothetical protein